MAWGISGLPVTPMFGDKIGPKIGEIFQAYAGGKETSTHILLARFVSLSLLMIWDYPNDPQILTHLWQL